MLTLNQIKNKLINFFEQHKLVQTVKYQDDFDFNAEKELNYPVAHLNYIESNIYNKVIAHSFMIELAGLTNDNIIGIDDEIISDMHLIAEDFFTFLQNEKGWIFTKNSFIQKFIDDTGDRISGITFRVTLEVIRSQNHCHYSLM